MSLDSSLLCFFRGFFILHKKEFFALYYFFFYIKSCRRRSYEYPTFVVYALSKALFQNEKVEKHYGNERAPEKFAYSLPVFSCSIFTYLASMSTVRFLVLKCTYCKIP